MKLKLPFLSLSCLLFLNSCSILNQKADFEIASNIYKNVSKKNIYLENSNDTLRIYSKDSNNTDFTQTKPQVFLKESNKELFDSPMFYKNSIDVDFLTIPFKYRPKQSDFPNQFTTNLNGAIYFGNRTDVYKIKYTKDPLKKYHRNVKHYAFSFGVFTGFGGTTMNPSVTHEKINIEYDGLVWSKGVAGIMGINNFTVGLAFGFDDLLDKNRNDWIYQQKAWYGLTFGLNLN